MFKDKVIVITGASRGIGLGTARRFAQDGARVVITDLDRETGEKVAAELQAQCYDVQFVYLDVRQFQASVDLVDRLARDYGHIDVWVNNAGVAHKGPAETLPLEQWDDSVAVMLSGPFYCSQAAGRQMLEQGSGVIVNVSSTGGLQYIEGRVAYSVPKAGLIMLTQALGIEWASRGVRVVGIAPGVVMTEMVKKGIEQGVANMDAYIRRTPLRRIGTVDEIAEAIYYLASDEASYVVAETLRVDGGWTAYQLF
jgi:NAD(P)-dependent dehydrogenase (short-subunit alcohol dehydrogenase family)